MKNTVEKSAFQWTDVFVILFCGLILMILNGGIYYNFGTFYLLILENNPIPPPILALIGTTADTLFVFVLPYAATYLKRNHLTVGILVGGLMISSGLLISSYIHQLYAWFFTYSIIIGLGEGITYMAVVEMVLWKGPSSLKSFMMGFTSGGMFIGLSVFAPE